MMKKKNKLPGQLGTPPQICLPDCRRTDDAAVSISLDDSDGVQNPG